MNLPAAVVFDCDGVLVDSEPHSVTAWIDVLSRLGHPATSNDIAGCTGLGFLPTHQRLTELGALPEPDAVWVELMISLERSFDTGLVVFDDAMSVLAAVAERGVARAVASASPRQRLDLTLGRVGLDHQFSVSVAGDEVERSKPAPDVYAAAVDLLDHPAGRLVAIEDSVVGVKSAVSAGLETFAVARSPQDRGVLGDAGAIVIDRLNPALIGL